MFLRFNLYTFLWAACMFALNLAREQGLANIPILYWIHFDDLAHFLQFCLLSFVMIVGFSKQQLYITLRFNGIRYALIICIAYSFLLEIIQLLRLPEYFEFSDLLSNILGSVGGALIFYFVYNYNREY